LNVAQQGVCVTALSIIIALLSNVKQLPVASHALRSVGWITLFQMSTRRRSAAVAEQHLPTLT
jgi:hypothetical protein